jgi:hypothetical protein
VLQATQKSVREQTVSKHTRIFYNQAYAKIAGFAFLVGTISSYWFAGMARLYPSVSVGYFVLIAVSSIVAFGYYANLLKSDNKNNFASFGAWVLAYGNPVLRVANSISIIAYGAGTMDLTSNAIFHILTSLYGIAYVVFGIGQIQTKVLTGKSTLSLGITSIVFGLTYLIHYLVLRRLAPLVLISNLAVYCLFLYMLYPRLPTTNKLTRKSD